MKKINLHLKTCCFLAIALFFNASIAQSACPSNSGQNYGVINQYSFTNYGYADPVDSFTAKKQGYGIGSSGYPTHIGVDWFINDGNSVHAICDGAITSESQDFTYQRTVRNRGLHDAYFNSRIILKCDSGPLVIYGHVDGKTSKNPVKKGDVIGNIAPAYNSNNVRNTQLDHLHLGIRTGYSTAFWSGGVGFGIAPYSVTLAQANAKGYQDPLNYLCTNPLAAAVPTVTLKNPANGAVSVAPTNVAFSWSSQNATNHRIVISTTSNFSGFVDAGGSSYCSNTSTCWTTTTGSSTSSTWNLASGKTYYWKVRASGSGGDVWSSPWNFTTASATSKPVAPTGLSASASGTSITFRWNDVSSNESGFRVYRWNGSTWASLATTSANATSFTNSGLASNTTYYYTVSSYNSAGESYASSYAYATTGSSGSVPGSVSVNPSSGSWTSNQNLAVTSAGATTIYYTMVNTYDGSTPYDPSSPSQSNYNGTLSGPSATFSLYGSSGQLKKSKLRFVGCNNYGCGAASGVYSCSIDQRSTVSKPAAPGSQSAAATSSSSIILRWSDLSNNESGFRPYRWNGSSWSSLGNVSANSTSYVNSGLSANTAYYYTVCSYNSAGESCPSNYVSATTSSGSSGSSWDGKSPSGTACEQDAVTVAYNSNSYGKVELRWSNTCKTNWTRVVPNSSSYSTYGKIRRTSDQLSYTTSGTGSRFTAMVYAPTVQACASGSINGYSLSEVCR